jgi:thiol-disulfide isomerase/thioredoxin
VLAYDKLASTVLRIGEILIERNLDVKKGREFVINAFPELSVEFHKYRAYMLLARSDIALGYFSSASENYKSALNIRPNRLSAWYEYLGLARISEQTSTTKMIREKIKELENEESNNYVKESTASSNINKKIEDLALLELNGKLVKLKEYIGKVILINRFGFWCGWCIKEFPTLQKIIKEFPEVVFLFINSGDSSEELKEYYFRKKEFGFLKEQTVLWTNKQYFDLIYGRSIPHTLVIDKKSNIRFDYMGYNENLESLLRKNLMKLLNE